jgi:hypothetical protein
MSVEDALAQKLLKMIWSHIIMHAKAECEKYLWLDPTKCDSLDSDSESENDGGMNDINQ